VGRGFLYPYIYRPQGALITESIVNPRTVEGLEQAHRIVEKGGIKPTVIRPDDMIIAHVPFSTYNRFVRKMGNIERSLTVFGHRLIGS
jgi:hypothetical protein